ncbi:MAG: glycosyltransferase [Thermoleophilaceae bacterium]|nr:glycosyltransferase [Thermoleophilaceae bacterium]
MIVDVALFLAERSGGIRTYLNEKSSYATQSGAFEHHVVFPGRRERHEAGRHELRSVPYAASNGYRIPFGAGALMDTLRRLSPDVVVLHDPFWRPAGVTREAHALGARVIAVHHASAALNAAGLPGPAPVYLPLLKRIYRHAYQDVDAVMSVVDPSSDSGRHATIPLRFGLHRAFRPAPAVRGGHFLYVGRLSLEKRICDLLEVMAHLGGTRELVLIGDGPARRTIAARAAALGLGSRVRFAPFVSDRHALARAYREAACVIDPGPYETFGLVVLEAAASGAQVVACSSTPSAQVAAPLVETFRAKDPQDLALAIERALGRPGDAAAAMALAERLTWPRVFEAELADLERLLG